MAFDIKRMDIYRKVPKDLTQPTTTGAIISICCVVFMLFMLGTELVWFISPDVRSELVVVNSDPTERIPVKINISIPRMKCEFLGIDIQVWHFNCPYYYILVLPCKTVKLQGNFNFINNTFYRQTGITIMIKKDGV